MKSLVTFTSLTILLLATSCEKQNLLRQEVAKAEAEIQATNAEMQSLDAKFTSLGGDPYAISAYYKRQHDELQQKNKALQEELAALTQRCTNGEKVLKDLRSTVDAYLARQ